jgi:hypothetical protein
MNLRDAISQLRQADHDATLFVGCDGPIRADMPAAIGQMSEDNTLPPESDGLRVFLDIWHVREVLEGKAALAGFSAPTIEQQIQHLREYAENGC